MLGIVLLFGSASAITEFDEKWDTKLIFNLNIFGMDVGDILKVFIIAACALMLWDAVLRFSGKKLFGHGVFYISRFIWFIYGSSVMWMLGGQEHHGYGKAVDNIFGGLYTRIYHGYFGGRWFTFWSMPINIVGYYLDPTELLMNSCFIELIVMITLRILEIIFFGNRKDGGKWGHLFTTLRRCASVYLGMYIWQYGIRWFSWIHAVGQAGATGRANFNTFLSYVLALYIIFEMGYFLVEILLETLRLKEKLNKPATRDMSWVQ